MKKTLFIAAVCSLFILTACSLPAPLLSQPVTENTPTAQDWELITTEDAQGIALDHARLTEDKVTGLRVSFEIDDNRPEYDVSFFYNDQEYDYEIHGESGRIMSHERDRK